MDTLTLGPKGTLIRRDFDRDADEPTVRNVAEDAVAYLFEPVDLHPDLKLGDILKLFDTCPKLHAVFRRDWSVELCEEASKGPLPPRKNGNPADDAGIEYLELYWAWALDTHSQTWRSVHSLELHGIGPVLEFDAENYGVKAGERVKWSVSLTPVRELLELPLRLCEELSITEDDIDARGYGNAVMKGRCNEVLLGQIIRCILDDLCFHGGPQETAEVSASLKAQVADIEAGTVKLTPADDLFDKWDRPGFSALFETLGDVRPAEVRHAMHGIEDDLPVGPALDSAFDGRVVVKEPFRNRPGREFRRLFRAASR
ncbi:MAG: hypothetical protein LBQ20_06760 [Rhodanobacter sp.]|nr:hypothetical protein [Rhodanobacter sp.]